jgi:hypothetical protein
MRRRSGSVRIAFAVGPPAASAVLAALMFALGLAFEERKDEIGEIVAIIFATSLLFGYLATIVLGLPGYLFFRHLGWLARRHCFLLGAIVGLVDGALLVTIGILGGGEDVERDAAAAIIGGLLLTSPLILTMGALFAWLIRRSASDIDTIASTFD